ncbi:Uncharacterized protein conserved in bacteria [Slackia heliotrinireducens]|uniref:Uncharacterized conserved protein n=1 Tax=Slackia heliotrinireducens (strain ATCC 29202 / DSM 20476 / NCTC 11029 / RHS 1) TaxID=471855 RepID=C7N850_SLAHD|nr:DUF1846 domain-containing protein [Slackia heliotrinireducens]ACV23085.1 uncharacterized conserved protein [Slackia heliotrinireducens DSM 20476]VEH02063.1 Uncharacterized protein conserved in bacteria [Slackia heliotrinireducens]
MKIGFDNEMYIERQAARIRERVEEFGGKLYLEFGGKLFDDYHAARVLPGFEPDVKLRMLKSMVDEVEIVQVINAGHIEKNKLRGDLGITYDEDLLRLRNIFIDLGFYCGGVVLTQYEGQPNATAFIHRLENMGIPCYRHKTISGYPYDIEHIVSDDGYGQNEYVKTTRPIVVVTAPGPGSGKMATCLSQLYAENMRGVKAGYAKYETFPVWNLPLDHPVNIAYESATVDLDDVNAIDPFHLEAYGISSVNYNRDIEIFPVLKAMLEKMLGESPYKSPTDMGVNNIAAAIVDEEAVCDAAKNEIVRRYFQCAVKALRTGMGENEAKKALFLMNKAGVNVNLSPAHSAALLRAETSGGQAGAMVLPDGRIITGKTSTLLNASSSVLLNALKAQAGIDDATYVISDAALEPICDLRTQQLGHRNPHLHPSEMLIALSTSSLTSPLAKETIAHASELRGCDAYFSSIIPTEDERLFRTLGINVCCEPRFDVAHSLMY